MIYLDNNATTAVDPVVRDAMLPYLTESYGNPSSMHRFGQEARQAVERARHQVASLLGCDVRELLFTSGGTESDNAAIHGALAAAKGKKLIITSTVEHSAIREPLAALKKSGIEIVEIGVDQTGTLDMAALEAVLKDRANEIALVTIMWVNNETGIIFDIGVIGEMCRKAGVLFHVDGVQGVGKMGMDLRHWPVDLLSLSAHKFHGPKGVGALYVRRGVRWQAWQRGGPQERERRGGTENVAGIVGMGVAAEMAQAAVTAGDWTRVARIRDRFETGILERIPQSFINGDPTRRVPNTTNIGFAGLEAEAILLLLSEQDVCASAGAACASGSLEPSHVLKAMHLPDPIAHGALRFSLSRKTTEADIEGALAVIPTVIRRLRETLPI